MHLSVPPPHAVEAGISKGLYRFPFDLVFLHSVVFNFLSPVCSIQQHWNLGNGQQSKNNFQLDELTKKIAKIWNCSKTEEKKKLSDSIQWADKVFLDVKIIVFGCCLKDLIYLLFRRNNVKLMRHWSNQNFLKSDFYSDKIIVWSKWNNRHFKNMKIT